MALLFASMEIGKATAFGPDVSLAKESAKHIFELLDREPAMEISADTTDRPVNISPCIVPDYYFRRYTISRKHSRICRHAHARTHARTLARTHTHNSSPHIKHEIMRNYVIVVVSELFYVSRVVTARLHWTTSSSHTHPDRKHPSCGA